MSNVAMSTFLKYLGEPVYKFLLGLYLEVELLQHRMCVRSASGNIAKNDKQFTEDLTE